MMIFITEGTENNSSFRDFQVFLSTSLKKLLYQKSFQCLKKIFLKVLGWNTSKKLQEWWTDDIDGDFVNFNL